MQHQEMTPSSTGRRLFAVGEMPRWVDPTEAPETYCFTGRELTTGQISLNVEDLTLYIQRLNEYFGPCGEHYELTLDSKRNRAVVRWTNRTLTGKPMVEKVTLAPVRVRRQLLGFEPLPWVEVTDMGAAR